MKKTATALILMGFAGSALAAPAFDRPGTAFNPDVLAPGSTALEQGLPDLTRNKIGNTTSTLYQFESRLRVGVSDSVEVQLFGDIYNQLKRSGNTADGAGNTGLAVKVKLPTQSDGLRVGLMASVEYGTGKPWFRNYDDNGKQASKAYIGATSSWDLSDTQTFTGYLDINRVGNNDLYTFAPNWQVALDQNWNAYLEYKVSFGDIKYNDNLAGGGLTWMATDKLQLDLYSLFGITSNSTDYESGFGVSYLFR